MPEGAVDPLGSGPLRVGAYEVPVDGRAGSATREVRAAQPGQPQEESHVGLRAGVLTLLLHEAQQRKG